MVILSCGKNSKLFLWDFSNNLGGVVHLIVLYRHLRVTQDNLLGSPRCNRKLQIPERLLENG